MKSHELANFLLNNPNLPVVIHTINGFEEIKNIEIENNQTELVFNSDPDKNIYALVSAHNENPSIILISDSFGVSSLKELGIKEVLVIIKGS